MTAFHVTAFHECVLSAVGGEWRPRSIAPSFVPYQQYRYPMRLLLLIAALLLAGGPAYAQSDHEPAHASVFDDLLATYVDDHGHVDYKALNANRAEALDPYLEALATATPDALSESEQRAFWINAYNALAIAFVLDHYPIQTIWETTPGSTAETSEVNPFEEPVGLVAGRERSLDEIQYTKVAPLFEGPGYHFALVCAAVSCPPLRQEAYRGARLDEQLAEQASEFLAPLIEAAESGVPLPVSQIVRWYPDDFGATDAEVQQTLADWVQNSSVAERLRTGAFTLDDQPYNWTLNDTN